MSPYWKSEDCGNSPCERKLRTSARQEGMTLRIITHRTECLTGFKYCGKKCIEEKTYVSTSSYYMYVVAIKESVCVRVYVHM